MESADAKRVWVLGAGFSRPLGGPLLVDMLSENMRDLVRVRFGNIGENLTNLPEIRVLHWLYRDAERLFSMNERPPGELPGVRIPVRWDNAEEFLVWLDNACVRNSADEGVFHHCMRQANLTYKKTSPEEFMPYWAKVTPMQVHACAKILLSLEASAFLSGEKPNYERWDPYTRWVSELTPSDVSITFNYDCAVELADQGKRICVPTSPDWIQRVRGRRPLLLKLHGSANWYEVNNKIEAVPDECTDLTAFPDKLDYVLIGIPGRSKTASAKKLEFLWQEARLAISEAEEMNIVGYGFPKSDNYARMDILDSLKTAKQLRKIRIVLGPQNPNSLRIRDLLKLAVPDKTVIEIKELWAEDLLGR